MYLPTLIKSLWALIAAKIDAAVLASSGVHLTNRWHQP